MAKKNEFTTARDFMDSQSVDGMVVMLDSLIQRGKTKSRFSKEADKVAAAELSKVAGIPITDAQVHSWRQRNGVVGNRRPNTQAAIKRRAKANGMDGINLNGNVGSPIQEMLAQNGGVPPTPVAPTPFEVQHVIKMAMANKIPITITVQQDGSTLYQIGGGG